MTIKEERFKGFSGNMKFDIIADIREVQAGDESIAQIIELCKKKNDLPKSVQEGIKKYNFEEDLLWFDGRIYVPEDKDTRLKIMRLHHDSPIAGHQGHARTLELISRRYYWPGLKSTVNKYVDSCKQCQRAKGTKTRVPLKPLEIPKGPWEEIAYDFITKLPKSQGSDSILVVVD
jgi:hypothetical protein